MHIIGISLCYDQLEKLGINPFRRVSGRYPWDMEYMHMMYGTLRTLLIKRIQALTIVQGDVVRTGPNELTFATPQSFNGK